MSAMYSFHGHDKRLSCSRKTVCVRKQACLHPMGSVCERHAQCTCARGVHFVSAGEGKNARKDVVREHQV